MKIKLLSAVLAAAFAVSCAVYAENKKVEISFNIGDSIININGVKTETETPYIAGEGTTLVPLRVITEAFGSEVRWDGEEKKITLSYPGINTVLQIGNPSAVVNGSIMALPEPPALSSGGVTMVPLRFISEAFGAEVSYDKGSITVIKDAAPETQTPEPTQTPAPTQTPEPENTPEQTARPLIEPEPLVTPQPAEYLGNMDFNAGMQIVPAKTGALITIFESIISDDEDMNKEYDEWGIIISKDLLALSGSEKLVAKRNESIINGETIVHYTVDFKRSGMTLEPDTTYYIWAYGVKGGIEHRHKYKSFHTLRSSETLRVRGETANITDTGAVLRGFVTDRQYLGNSNCHYVFYLGTSEDSMQPVILDFKDGKIESTTDFPLVPDSTSGIFGTIGSGLKYGDPIYGEMIYNADTKEDLGVTLEPDTTYYWKYMFIWDGEEFATDTMTFTTSKTQ